MNKPIDVQTALITGANNGIGLALTRRLLGEGWHVAALIRSDFLEDDEEIQAAMHKGQLRVYKADIADFASLKQALKRIKLAEVKLDLLFNNAGGSFSELQLTRQGRELHFDLQTVAPYAIFMELKELLKKGSYKTVVNTSTNSFKTLKKFDAQTLEHPTEFKKLFGPYSTSKLALSLWTKELAPVLAAEGLRIISVDPGGNNTIRKGKKSGLPFYITPIMKLFFPHPSKGASLLYEAAIGKQRQAEPGTYLVNGKAGELHFTDQSAKVLNLVSSIYNREFGKSLPN
ncbi:SDR family NAD(P)-dependent oxidoreductase [Paenibacillus algorifonticola]|uniref:SDR family NAD(P)-dependent oxidoreductase n=1 Tax=Paenibacillus algorifonticola TaxID=684063 RepID=UPI003D2B24FE